MPSLTNQPRQLTRRTVVLLPQDLRERTEVLAEKNGVSLGEIVRRALELYPPAPTLSVEEEELLSTLACSVTEAARRTEATLDELEAELGALKEQLKGHRYGDR